MICQNGNPYANIGSTSIAVHTSAAYLDIRCDTEKPANYVGINGRTLLDIIVEQELLGL